MTKEAHIKRLAQEKHLKWFQRQIHLTELIPVCLRESNDEHIYGLHCALVPIEKREMVVNDLGWDLQHCDGKPGAITSWPAGDEVVEYYRFGDDTGIEPLVIDRHFHGMRPEYVEISEEFRLFHDLYYDKKSDQYLKIDDAGNEHIIIVVKENRVDIRLKELLQFVAVKEMYLSIQFDYREMAPYKLEELGLTDDRKGNRDDLMVWDFHYGDMGFGEHRAFSRLWGKRLLKPLSKEKSGFPGFAKEEPENFVDFIIGIDDEGSDITYTSNPDRLANYFGANPNSPHYLTPVHFRKQVLDKYYQQPSKYSVEDCYLRCGSLWGLQMDNQHPDQVCAWLGDLGRDLPYEEQLHWRAYNTAPQGDSPVGVSETYFRRQILAQWTDSNRPEDQFHRKYKELQERSEQRLGWSLLKPLNDGDSHHLSSLRIPANDEQREFDDLILGLTKILIDSINEKELRKLISPNKLDGLRGSISLLEKVLTVCSVDGYEPQISFMRDLQELRSSGAAHRKGNTYKKTAEKLGISGQPLPVVFSAILSRTIELLDYLISSVDSMSKPTLANSCSQSVEQIM